MRRVAVIIPARFGASRFPGKPLADLCGRPVIAHVVERALRARGADVVAVATDDERIAEAARRAGAQVVITGPAPTGTDRVALAARALVPRPDVIVNLQGDEPMLEPEAVEAVIRAVLDGAEMATLARPLEPEEWLGTQAVKVVTDARGDALYFSRAPIPHRRGGGMPAMARAHVGIYGFTAGALERFAGLPAGRLEQEEALEQLRALEQGLRIRVVDTNYMAFGVDTPEDLERARALVATGT